MMMFKYSIKLFTVFMFLALGFSSCVDQEFDIPPGRDVQVEDISNTTIAELKANFNGGNSSYTIPEDVIIKGVVVSNDEAGNFFNTIVIQDETAGIHISIETEQDLFINYPPGRTVYFQGGLALGQFADLVQIGIPGGGSNVNRIPQVMFEEFAIIGEKVEVPTPKEKTISELREEDLSTLIQLNDVEYSASLIGQTYAVSGDGGTQNRLVLDCNGNEIILRNSDFADFANVPIPEGNGSLVGVYSIFGTTKQFTIRDTDDVNFTNDRCDGTTGSGDQISIENLRAAFNNGATVAPNGYIEGVVISDVVSGNTLDLNLVLQDGSGGIAVRFTDAHTYGLGSRIAVNISGVELSEFNGLLQVNDAPITNSSFISANNSVTPNVVTIDALLSDFENLESTLVQINNVELTGSNTFAGDLTVSDATGSLNMFTRNNSAFANDLVPTGEVTLVGMASEFTSDGDPFNPQIIMRKRSDVDGGGTGNPVTLDLPANIGFDSGIPTGWIVTNTVGNREWQGDDFGGEFFAEMSSFNSGDILDVVSWLVTPEIDFDAQSGETLEIVVADAFRNGNPLQVFYANDYSGSGNPSGSTWTQIGASQIDPIINNPDTFDNNFESTGDIDISMINGKGYLAFVYDAMNATVSTTIQINEINIE